MKKKVGDLTVRELVAMCPKRCCEDCRIDKIKLCWLACDFKEETDLELEIEL